MASDAPLLWEFDPFAVPAGEVRRVRWAFALAPDGGAATIPIIVIAGARSGPSAALVAGVHGDEFEGPPALWQLAGSIRPADVAGRLIILPIAHGAAFNAGLRASPIDGVNLARVFPGDPDGTITYRLAHHLFANVVSRADLLVDCHSGGVRLAFAPVAGFYPEGDGITEAAAAASLDAARWMGLQWLWALPHRPGVLSYEAARRGVAVTGCEIGGRGGRLAGDTAMYHDGIRRLLQAKGILAGDPPPPPVYNTYLSGDWALAPAAGLLENHVELGQRVTVGTHIATIRGVFGEELACLNAPVTGIVMGLRHFPSVQPGEWATCVVEEKPL